MYGIKLSNKIPLPEEEYIRIVNEFWSIFKNTKNAEEYNKYLRDKNYVKSINKLKTIQDDFDRFVENQVKDMQRLYSTTVKVSELGLSDEDIYFINKHLVSMYVLCDLLEGVNMDLNDYMKKYDIAYINTFDEIARLAHKYNASKLYNSDYAKDSRWGDAVDEFKEKLIEKAKEIIILRADKSWGTE